MSRERQGFRLFFHLSLISVGLAIALLVSFGRLTTFESFKIPISLDIKYLILPLLFLFAAFILFHSAFRNEDVPLGPSEKRAILIAQLISLLLILFSAALHFIFKLHGESEIVALLTILNLIIHTPVPDENCPEDVVRGID